MSDLQWNAFAAAFGGSSLAIFLGGIIVKFIVPRIVKKWDELIENQTRMQMDIREIKLHIENLAEYHKMVADLDREIVGMKARLTYERPLNVSRTDKARVPKPDRP